MSVILWSAEELGQVAACASREMPRVVGTDPVKGIAQKLAEYSRANTNAFKSQYKDKEAQSAEALDSMSILRSARLIEDELRRDGPEATKACERAKGTAELLAYNAIDNSGKSFLPEAMHGFIRGVAGAATRAHATFIRNDKAREDATRAVEVRLAAEGRAVTVPSTLRPFTPPNAVTRETSRYVGKYPNQTVEKYAVEEYTPTEAVRRIKNALKARTGRAWSVHNSNSREGVKIDAPDARKVCFRNGQSTISRKEMERWWGEHGYGALDEKKAEAIFDAMCNDDRALLSKALDREHRPNFRGEYPADYDCWGYGCRANTVARAEGRKPTTDVTKYEYD
jgi:hypothetical protein